MGNENKTPILEDSSDKKKLARLHKIWPALLPDGIDRKKYRLSARVLIRLSELFILGKRMITEKSDAWLEFIKKQSRTGLGSKEGRWGFEVFFRIKKGESEELVYNYISELLGKIFIGKEFDSLTLEPVLSSDGTEIKDIKKEHCIIRGPIVVRVVRNGNNDKPVSFVDIRFSEEVFNKKGLLAIDFQGLIDSGAVLGAEGVIVGQERLLDDWYIEEDRKDKFDKYFRPTVIIHNTKEQFHEITNDTRPVIALNLKKEKDAIHISVVATSHTPVDGADFNQPLDKTDEKFASMIEKISPEYGVHISPFYSLLSKHVNPINIGEAELLENTLAGDCFVYPVMREFAKNFDLSSAEISFPINKNLMKMLLGAKDKDLVAASLTSLATFLTLGESPGIPALPNNDEVTRLMIWILGNRSLKAVKNAEKLVGENEEEVITQKYLQIRLMLGKLINSEAMNVESIEQVNRLLKTNGIFTEIEKQRTGGFFESLLFSLQNEIKIAKFLLNEISGLNINNISVYQEKLKQIINKDINVLDATTYGLGTTVLKLFDLMSSIKTVFNSDEFEILEKKDKIITNLSSLFSFVEPNIGFPISKKILELAAKEIHIKIKINEKGEEYFEFPLKYSPERMISEIKFLFQFIIKKEVDDFIKHGVKHIFSKLNRAYKNHDIAHIGSLSKSVISGLQEAGENLKIIREAPEKNSIAVGLDAEIPNHLARKFFLKRVSEVLADLKPTVNTSTIPKQVFFTALEEYTKIGVGFTRESTTFKFSADNPQVMFEVILPYIKENQEFRKLFDKHIALSTQLSKKQKNLLKKIISVEYLDAYEKKKFDGTTDAFKREELIKETLLFFEEFNKLDNADIFKIKLIFNDLWKTRLHYLSKKQAVSLANITYILLLNKYKQEGVDLKKLNEKIFKLRSFRAEAIWKMMEEKTNIKNIINRVGGVQ